MKSGKLPSEFIERLKLVTGKRSRIVVDHILEHGSITTEDLEQIYGYKHPPRAVRDVRDQGIPIETYSVKSTDGRTIAAYRFGDPSDLREGLLGGRTGFTRQFRQKLYKQSDKRCGICNGRFALRELQVDHRIPYEIARDVDHSTDDTSAYMLLCGSCNRTKSWTCEHCPNWQKRDPAICGNCYWAQPTTYSHVATETVRRTEIVWQGEDETEMYEQLSKSAAKAERSIQEYIKDLLRNILTFVLR